MRPLAALAVAALAASGCATTVEVPATLYSPAPPSAVLFDGPGDVALGGGWGTEGWHGTASGSPLPHLGLRAAASSRRPRAATLGAGHQRMLDGAVTLYGPTAGRLRAEAELGAGAGTVDGYSGRYRTGGCLFACAPATQDLDAASTTASLDRRYAQVAVGLGGPDAVVGSGLVLRLTEARVSGVRLAGGVAGEDAREVFVEPGAFVRFAIGPADLDLALGLSHPVAGVPSGDRAEPGEPLALGGRYRTAPVSASVGLRVGLDDVWRAASRP